MQYLKSSAALVLALAASATAQEPIGPAPEIQAPGADPVQEMIRVFHEVERKLVAIDLWLADAGAGEVPLREVEDAGLDDLLREAVRGSGEVAAGIDELLELAQQMNASSGGGGGGGQPSSGESPLDKPRDQGPLDRESTPESPSGPQEGEEPKETGEDPASKDGEPKSPGKDEEPGENRPGDPRAEDPSNPVPPGQDANQWGFLPARTRQIFRNQGRDDLPIQYRDWIDMYYRRLSTQRR